MLLLYNAVVNDNVIDDDLYDDEDDVYDDDDDVHDEDENNYNDNDDDLFMIEVVK